MDAAIAAAAAELFSSNSQPSPLRERGGDPIRKGETAGGIFARAAMNAAHCRSTQLSIIRVENVGRFSYVYIQ